MYLTFGTFFNEGDAFRAALAGIRDLGVGLVVTVGPDGDPAAFDPQPPRVVVERYIPQTLLLPACDVLASHAGSGTVLGALALGIPQLCLPQAADQFLNAAAVARAGAGLAIPPEEVDARASETRSTDSSTTAASECRRNEWPTRSPRCRRPKQS